MGAAVRIVELSTGNTVQEFNMTGRTYQQAKRVEHGINLILDHNLYKTVIDWEEQ